ncbi:MAG: site-specific integrase [Acidobacteriales bacterium]|nr:site-specific integrase [Terriglobales bacterium]
MLLFVATNIRPSNTGRKGHVKGHIRKRGKSSWSIVVELEPRPDGKRRQKWETVHGLKKKAEERLAEILHSMNIGTYVEPAKLTVEEYLAKWLETVKVNLSGKTFERYREIATRHLVPALGPILLAKLTPLHIQAYYSKALQSGRLDKRQGGLSTQTVLHHHRVLRESLRQAVKWQMLVRNPADAVEPPVVQRKEMKALSESETAWLLKAAMGTKLYLPILLTVTTGLRRGELLALRWRDLDLEKGTLAVVRSVEETREGIRFKEPKTAKGRRLISLPLLSLEELRRHLSVQSSERRTLDSVYQDSDLVLSASDGQIWKPESFTALYFRFTKRIGVSLRFHDLRHTHATQLLKAGISAKVVSERLGHSSVGITLDVYSHVLPGMQEEAAARIDAALRKEMEKQRSCVV